MLTARRPSHTLDMRSVSIPFWLRGNYDAMTFFGSIVTHSQAEAERYNQLTPQYQSSKLHAQSSKLKEWYHPVKYHETIHLRQAQSVHNSWLCFYWKYFVFWLKACRYRKHLRNAGYLLNPFEIEAYAHMHDADYLAQNENGAVEWRRYAKMPLQERHRIYLSRYRSA